MYAHVYIIPHKNLESSVLMLSQLPQNMELLSKYYKIFLKSQKRRE